MSVCLLRPLHIFDCHLVYDLTQAQVGKAYFEMVDYLEADRAFSRARIASPYSLDGMDIYSTVLYVSFIFKIIFPVVIHSLASNPLYLDDS